MPVGRVAVFELGVGDRQLETVAEHLELAGGELLDLVRRVPRLDGGAERPPLDRLGEDHGGAALVLDRHLVRGVDLAVVVTAARQRAQLVVGEVLDQPPEARVGPEEVLADVVAALDRVLLELAVDGAVHLVDEHAVDVAGEQLVPARAPDHLDDVPPGAAEDRLELLDDLAVAAHRPVEPLQVAVDDEDQVVELLACRDRQPGHRFGLVHLAVADEGPHPGRTRVDDLAVQQVAVEARLGDRVQRAEAHRHGRELPELRHAPRVRVARQAAAVDLAAEPVELLLAEAPLEEGTRVDARRRVALEEDLVAEAAVALAAEEVVEADVVEAGRRRERGEVPAEGVEPVVRPVDHRHRVPADVGADPALEDLVTREPRLLLAGDRVDVVGADHRRHADALLPGVLHEPGEQVAGAGTATDVDDGVERIEPFARLLGVDVGQLVHEAIDEHRRLNSCRGSFQDTTARAAPMSHLGELAPHSRTNRRQ